MANAMTTIDDNYSGEVGFAGGANPFLQAANELGVGGAFGRFNGKTGEYVFGDATVDPGVVCAFEFMSAKLVWLGFDLDNKPHRGPEASLLKGEKLLDPPSADKRIKWNRQLVVPIVTFDGQRILYSSKADWPSRPGLKLMKEYGSKMGANVDGNGRYMVPVVEMNNVAKTMMVDEPTEFKNPDGSAQMRKVKVTFYQEVFNIVEWYTVDDVADIMAGEQPGSQAEPEVRVINGNDVSRAETVEAEIIEPAPKAAPAATPAAAGMRRPVRAGARA